MFHHPLVSTVLTSHGVPMQNHATANANHALIVGAEKRLGASRAVANAKTVRIVVQQSHGAGPAAMENAGNVPSARSQKNNASTLGTGVTKATGDKTYNAAGTVDAKMMARAHTVASLKARIRASQGSTGATKASQK